MEEIKLELTNNRKEKPTDESTLGFGNVFTDHMFVMNYDKGKGWHSPRIVPYGPISLYPSAMCLHYAQEVFEGLKAYKSNEGKVFLFRPEKNAQRLNVSNERLCIPELDEDLFVNAVKKLVHIEKDWIPTSPGTSLYLRPFIFATEPSVGVHAAEQLLFIIFASPSGPYYAEGINPVKIYVETEYVRAVRGGIGFAKAAANYAAAIKAQAKAQEKKYSQVLWLDGIERKYIEEVGTMNVFFVINDEIITPALQGSILPGITRLSVIEMLRSWGYSVTERSISIDEVYEASKAGTLKEAFGTGTAAVISPIGTLCWNDDIIHINNNKIGPISQKLYDTITSIQCGKIKGPKDWVVEVD